MNCALAMIHADQSSMARLSASVDSVYHRLTGERAAGIMSPFLFSADRKMPTASRAVLARLRRNFYVPCYWIIALINDTVKSGQQRRTDRPSFLPLRRVYYSGFIECSRIHSTLSSVSLVLISACLPLPLPLSPWVLRHQSFSLFFLFSSSLFQSIRPRVNMHAHVRGVMTRRVVMRNARYALHRRGDIIEIGKSGRRLSATSVVRRKFVNLSAAGVRRGRRNATSTTP